MIGECKEVTNAENRNTSAYSHIDIDIQAYSNLGQPSNNDIEVTTATIMPKVYTPMNRSNPAHITVNNS